MGYAKAIAKMESIPEGERVLLCDAYFDGKNCCAVGLICPSTRDWRDSYESAYDLFDYRTVRAEAKALGLAREDLVNIQEINDEFKGSDEERFEHVLSQLRELEKGNNR